MASSCTQLCLKCRGLLCSKTVASAWSYSTQLRHCTKVAILPAKILNGSSAIEGNHTTTGRQQWKQQMFCYSDLTAKHLATEAKESNDIEDLSRADVVAYKTAPIRDAVPVTESQTSFDLDAAAEFSALEEISDEEAVSISVPSAMPPASISLRDYVDQSETLSKLVQLGVNLWKLEQRPNVGSMLLRLNFNTDVAPRLLFLKDIGVEDSCFGYIITHNPFILTENLENLQARVNYLKSKKFSSETVASMVSRAPYLLNFSVKRLDNRLGFYQQQLSLSASNTRNVVARLPRLLCGSLEPVKENLKVCEIELGFKQNEIQHIVIAVPKVLTANKRKLIQIFDFLHNIMKVPHHLICKFPQVLNTKYLRIKERHLFLEYLGKAQYDPSLPNYISLDRLVSLPDETFCTELALATLEDFYLFQKTL
ncbi:transcription termination factor 3, mitochondrial [Chelmon rostratus]|uniref:transcription termination factor 3, mitochondrial n=1 Tax=Chelmon rostratus TaxID=109905 RepID=UPI001BEBC0EB|nr:transcription termination factor 3, mitochondrial [Chelmon rostratus]XP_041811683.1 transcription termination factor 3, mitochondrial [Chelmon rostratus]XP_041811684.1 transcription termination factor 3, mitochondrial [Chelmon rostratus]XP_041811685.1 transcription termination factor 3, mitochondrial [Chelmon rostratus]